MEQPQPIARLINLQALAERLRGLKNSEDSRDFTMTSERRRATSRAMSECPFNLCDGSGLVVRVIDGFEVARFCKCHEQQEIDRRFRSAAIPAEFAALTIASFSIDRYRKPDNRKRAYAAKKIAVNYVEQFRVMQSKGKGLYLYGRVKGSGKTRLAASMANALIRKYSISAKFITTVDFFNEIRATFDRETGICASDLIDAARQVDLLILDDIGTEKQESPWVNETMYAVLDHRMNQRKTTMFTSNCTIESLLHNDKIKSRIERMVLPVWMPEEEIRADLARAENEELQKLLLGV